MFSFTRRSTFGKSIPTWLTSQNKILIRNFNRQSKHDPLVEELELVEANPEYAYVRFPNGRETSIAIKNLAPTGVPDTRVVSEMQNSYQSDFATQSEVPDATRSIPNNSEVAAAPEYEVGTLSLPEVDETVSGSEAGSPLRRSTRARNQPNYLHDYVSK